MSSSRQGRATLLSYHHDDFEYSLVLAGEFVHHLRWPWNTDLSTWREDETTVCAGPSLAVIPPPAIHTTRSTGARDNLIVDIFAASCGLFSEAGLGSQRTRLSRARLRVMSGQLALNLLAVFGCHEPSHYIVVFHETIRCWAK